MIILGSKFCPYDDQNKLDGIFNYFRSQVGDIFYDQKGLITMSASTNEAIAKYVLINNNSESFYWSGDGVGNWIEVGFGKNKVKISGYTFRSFGRDFLTKWEVAGSNDGVNWNVIDTKTFSSMPTDVLDNRYFKIDKELKYKRIRFISRGPRFGSDFKNTFFIHRIELFGDFYSRLSDCQTCKTKKHFNKLFTIFMVLVS